MIKLSQDRLGEILTIQQAIVLADIIQASQQKATVAWIFEEGAKATYGTVRSIGDQSGYFLSADDDVRDAFLRITTRNGWEQFLPIKQVADLVRRGYMVFNPD